MPLLQLLRWPMKSKQRCNLWKDWAVVSARAADFGGFVMAVLGALDWSPLMNLTDMSKRHIIVTGAGIILIGISHELALRRQPPNA